MKVFFIYTGFLAIFSISKIIAKLEDAQLFQQLLMRGYIFFEYCLFALFFNKIYYSPLFKRIVIFSVIPFILFFFYENIKTSVESLPINSLIIEFLAFMVFILYFFYERMQKVVSFPLYQTISFWISVGLFLYFSGNFFFLLFKKNSTDQHLKTQMAVIYSLVTISKNILLSLAFLGNEIVENQEEEFRIPSNIDLDSFSDHNKMM